MAKIAVAGTGYVGLSLAVLLSQHQEVTAVDIIPEKVDLLNKWQSPIKDEYIEKFMAEHEERDLNLRATTAGDTAYADADFIIIAAPTNYDPKLNNFDTSAVEAVIEQVLKVNTQGTLIIKSTIPVGFTEKVKAQFNCSRIMFFPEFLRETKALYDNLYAVKKPPEQKNINKAVSDRLKAARTARGLKQVELAALAGVESALISEVENHNRLLTKIMAKKLADALMVGIDWLLYGIEDKKDYPVNEEMIDWLWTQKQLRKNIWEQMKSRTVLSS